MSRIHPSAVVDSRAELGADIVIGPFCVVAGDVVLGDRCRLLSHVSIQGPTRAGPDNEFHPFCSIGGATQDLKYRGEPTYLTIGAANRFREFVTINRGTAPGEHTVVGSHNNLLAYAHVAHNCVVGDHCVFSNNGTLAGHVIMEDHAIIGGLSAVHQFCRIGRFAMIGGCTKIVQDVPPFMVADGNPATVRAVNTVGLQRHGASEDTLRHLRAAHKILYDDTRNTSQALAHIETTLPPLDEIRHLVAFVRASQRGIIR